MGMTERQFQHAVIDAAHVLGWRAAHFGAAETPKGWRTVVRGDAAGFPDLVLVRDRVIFAELKSSSGRLQGNQVEWSDWLQSAGAEWYVWRPDDWDDIMEVLR